MMSYEVSSVSSALRLKPGSMPALIQTIEAAIEAGSLEAPQYTGDPEDTTLWFETQADSVGLYWEFGDDDEPEALALGNYSYTLGRHEEAYLRLIAPFIVDGGYLQYHSEEDGGDYRFLYHGGQLYLQAGEVTFPPLPTPSGPVSY